MAWYQSLCAATGTGGWRNAWNVTSCPGDIAPTSAADPPLLISQRRSAGCRSSSIEWTCVSMYSRESSTVMNECISPLLRWALRSALALQ